MADKEVEKIMEIIGSPEQIRNIGIVAHIDHGKCVAPGQRIALGSGKQIEAEALFERYREKGEEVNDTEEETRVDVSGLDLKVKTLKKSSGEIEDGKVTDIWKMKKDNPLVRVQLHNGRQVTVTPEHEFTTLEEDGAFSRKKADEIEETDTIVASRNLPANSLDPKQLKAEIINRLGEKDKLYVNLEKKFAEQLQEKIKKNGIEETYSRIKPVLKQESFKHCAWRGQYRLKTLVQLAELFDTGKSSLYDRIEKINYRAVDSEGGKSSLELQLPENLEALYYLAGMFLGDGDLSGNITNNSAEIQETVREKAEKLGLEPIKRAFEDRATRIEIGGKTLKTVLESLFDYPKEKKTGNIKISDLVFRSPNSLIAEFVKGYMDADGTVEKSRSAVSIVSKSTQMLDDLQMLLQRFDIATKLNRNNNTLYISGKLSLQNFQEIGFEHPGKQERLEEVLEKAQSAKVDSIPIDGKVLRETREKIEIPQREVFPSYSNYENNNVGLTKKSLKKITGKMKEEGLQGAPLRKLERLAVADTVFSEVDEVERVEQPEYVYDFTVEPSHNFIAEGIVVQNTTLSDNLLARAGMISDQLAGEQLFMDYDAQEQERGITIYSANISMVHELEDEKYLINLIDTPGHVDFGGDVTRAMRAVDGALVVVDAVDGVMPQTETVLRQALKERVKPILFINKVDRLINELQLSEQEMQQRFQKIIAEVNDLIKKIAPEEYKKDWQVNVKNGEVAFGSALLNWAISMPYMKKSGISFGDIIEKVNADKNEELAEEAPLHEVTLDMVVNHLVNPKKAQEYRIPAIWDGDTESEEGKAMKACDADGDVVGVVTNVESDKHAGTICTVRMFSGTIKEGQELFGIGSRSKQRMQKVGIYSGPRKLPVDEVPPGNIAALTGADYSTGETLVEPGNEIEPFEKIEHVFEPVVTKSIEPKNTSDLPDLIEALQKRAKEDNTIKVSIDEETGETLVSGLGELHIEAKIERYLEEQGIDIQVSEPIVVYRESVEGESEEFLGKSPNKHNKFWLSVEKVPEDVYEKLMSGDVPTGKVRSKDEDKIREELEDTELDKEDIQKIHNIYNGNLFIDKTRGVKFLNEVMELVVKAFKDICDEGPLANEPCMKLMVKIHDADIHEDHVHRGPAQVIPAVRESITRGMIEAGAKLLEPKQIIQIDSPQEKMGNAMKEVNNRRGQILNMEDEGDSSKIKASLPVAEMFGFEAALKSATGGKGFYNLMDQVFEALPTNLQKEVILDIRERKGMKKDIPGMDVGEE
ncbi:MAG: elongation factor EF-2 [Candidatus Nanohaloarchaea archaeon]|nr:elongation factor EF-2 [Candidatus Nanohaloarchaea archaeon]